MSAIRSLRAWQILDSRSNPTLAVEVTLTSGGRAVASVPSGLSTGTHEARELRDGGEAWGGMGVTKAVANVTGEIQEAVVGLEATDQKGLDETLIRLDGTPTKERLGANAILGVSLAAARAAAQEAGLPLYAYLGEGTELPVPYLNVVNGGRHADNDLSVQEFLIVPAGRADFRGAIRAASEIYRTLGKVLRSRHDRTSVGDEGGYAPDLADDEEAIRLLMEAISQAGYEPGKDVYLALDPAASEMRKDGGYAIGGRTLEVGAWLDLLEKWVETYPIVSLEDPVAEDDDRGWVAATERFGDRIQLVADDNFVTQKARLEAGAAAHIANAILIKPNQVGTLTETIETVRRAKELGYRTLLSHRSGETEDTFIADFAVGLGLGQIKTGAPARGERVAKYNRLMAIEEDLPLAGFSSALVTGWR